jgi:hypothetical protein
MALCGKSIVFLAQAKCPWGLACLDGDLCKQNAHAQFVVKFESLGEKFQGLGNRRACARRSQCECLLCLKADILAVLNQFLFFGETDIVRMLTTGTLEHMPVVFASFLTSDADAPHRRSALRT